MNSILHINKSLLHINKERFKFLNTPLIRYMLPKNRIKEGIGVSYVRAVCAKAGYSLRVDENDFGCDLTIREIKQRQSGKNYPSGIDLDLQIKCTENWREDNDNISFDLRNKNYNDLVEIENNATKKILVVFLMPKEENEWLNNTIDSLIIKKCAYWVSLEGKNQVEDNDSTSVVKIPKKNLFSSSLIDKLMNSIKRGGDFNAI